ncbi:hypothetical protein Tco_0321072 [Tanacetum coccineum]
MIEFSIFVPSAIGSSSYMGSDIVHHQQCASFPDLLLYIALIMLSHCFLYNQTASNAYSNPTLIPLSAFVPSFTPSCYTLLYACAFPSIDILIDFMCWNQCWSTNS